MAQKTITGELITFHCGSKFVNKRAKSVNCSFKMTRSATLFAIRASGDVYLLHIIVRTDSHCLCPLKLNQPCC